MNVVNKVQRIQEDSNVSHLFKMINELIEENYKIRFDMEAMRESQRATENSLTHIGQMNQAIVGALQTFRNQKMAESSLV